MNMIYKKENEIVNGWHRWRQRSDIFHPLMIFKGPFRSDEVYPRGLIGCFDWGDQQTTCEGTCH